MALAGPSLHERIVPYQGNWHFLWVLQRYLRAARAGMTFKKLRNAAWAYGEMRAGRTRIASAPVVLRIEPVNLCNLRCPRCSCGIGSDPREKGHLAEADYLRILDENRANAALIRLDGNGEPTLHPRIFDMVDASKSLGYALAMSTNFCTPQSADAQAFLDCGLDRLVVAVDGATQDSYERYRAGGNLELVKTNLERLLQTRRRLKRTRPLVEIQFLDWEYNHNEIPDVRNIASDMGTDKFEIIRPDWAVAHGTVKKNPKRCFWLWFVLTVDWQLNYHSCTNAWTLPWPNLNLKDLPSREFWNHELMVEARRYNLDKSSPVIASDAGCHCNSCSDMLVVNRPPDYVCE